MSRSAAPLRVVLCDAEERLRSAVADRLREHGYEVWDSGDPDAAAAECQREPPDVVLLDLPATGSDAERTLRSLRRAAPHVPIVVTTAHASPELAEPGRHDVFAVLEKPCDSKELVEHLEAAAQVRKKAPAPGSGAARARQALGPLWHRLWGRHGLRPGVLGLGAVLFALVVLAPTPDSLLRLVAAEKTGDRSLDRMTGYAGYERLPPGSTVAEAYSRRSHRVLSTVADAEVLGAAVSPAATAQAAQVSLGVMGLAALLWATGALPMGFTALLVGVLLMAFRVFPPEAAPGVFAKDTVIFVFGVLALGQALAATGLDRRIGLRLLQGVRSTPRFLFLFLPLLACLAAFLWSLALVAFLAPILMMAYLGALRSAGIRQDRALIALLLLGLCFTVNLAGPGSPAAGGQNAVMLGLLADHGGAPTFGQWMTYGLPFVPVVALAVGGYLFLVLGRKTRVRALDLRAALSRERDKLGPLSRGELGAAAILALVFLLWWTQSGRLGLSGPVLIGLVLMAVFRLVRWQHVSRISWDVVALYAAATGLGAALAHTGASAWVAGLVTGELPEALRAGNGLVLGAGLTAGMLTNLLGDGPTVAAVGSVTVPMAQMSGTSPWAVGLATAFASSFANLLIIGSPNNAMVYALARDPASGEQLVTMRDFAWHGLWVTVIAFAVLALWAVLGYWSWIGF